jgi:pimeloyl-ACP methyl ester carboxylesterase
VPEHDVTTTVSLSTGAEARLRNGPAPLAAVLLNGGTARAVPGTWSATSELLARELALRFPEVRFAEVRYRIKSWRVFESCVEDGAAALDAVVSGGAEHCLLVGFSMGGAVSIRVAEHDAVAGVLGLSPWIPPRLSLDGLRGKRLDILQGGLDRALPGIPGVSPSSSRAGFERARALGVEGSYAIVRGSRSGELVRLPRWRAWVDGVAARLDRFQASAGRRLRAS